MLQLTETYRNLWTSFWPTVKSGKDFLIFQLQYTTGYSRPHRRFFWSKSNTLAWDLSRSSFSSGKIKVHTLRKLKERLDNRLSGWKEKMLSHAGKVIFIKVVTQAIPMYTMSVFKIPNTLYDEMTSMVWNFWWGKWMEKIKWHGLVGIRFVHRSWRVA